MFLLGSDTPAISPIDARAGPVKSNGQRDRADEGGGKYTMALFHLHARGIVHLPFSNALYTPNCPQRTAFFDSKGLLPSGINYQSSVPVRTGNFSKPAATQSARPAWKSSSFYSYISSSEVSILIKSILLPYLQSISDNNQER